MRTTAVDFGRFITLTAVHFLTAACRSHIASPNSSVIVARLTKVIRLNTLHVVIIRRSDAWMVCEDLEWFNPYSGYTAAWKIKREDGCGIG